MKREVRDERQKNLPQKDSKSTKTKKKTNCYSSRKGADLPTGRQGRGERIKDWLATKRHRKDKVKEVTTCPPVS
ncbi:MAG: hypothetical protein GY777_31265 [Candidatus Brocadiaceae bacterium]|nr:hypothetical protein [Candidatus Brocadiaceae bacterium]